MRTFFLPMIAVLTMVACSVPTLSMPQLKSNPPSGSILFQDNFSSPASGWDRTKYPEGIMDYEGGGYRILVKALQVNLWSTPHKDFSDVRIEVDAGKLAGPDGNRVGIICRSDGSRYYFFIIGSDGFYGVGLFKDGQASLLGQSEMQTSMNVITGTAINHLRADCNGNDLAFYVNGARLADVNDPTLTHGDVGILAGTFDQSGVDVVFDNFLVLKP